jgi:hypothetical protein
LKNQVNRALEIFGFGQLLRSAQQHGGMPVVAARMHGACVFTRIGLLRFLLDGQGVHVCADGDAFAFTIFQCGHQAMATHIAGDVITPALQLIGHPLRGRFLLERKLRETVQMSPGLAQ